MCGVVNYFVTKMRPFLFYLLVSLAVCSCEQQDTRCSIYDNECTKDFFQNIAVQYASTGLPEVGVPIIDPFQLENVKLSILGLVDLTLVKGEAHGIGKCLVTSFETNIEARTRSPEIICKKITIKGKYKLSSAKVLEKACSLCDINGEGYGTIVLEDWYFKFVYPFKITRHENNKIYMDADFDRAVYKSSVGKVTVAADSIKSGKHDITDHVVSFVNKHWKLIMKSSIGKFINDESAKYYYDVYNAFFTHSPAEAYLKGDLTHLIEKPEPVCKLKLSYETDGYHKHSRDEF